MGVVDKAFGGDLLELRGVRVVDEARAFGGDLLELRGACVVDKAFCCGALELSFGSVVVHKALQVRGASTQQVPPSLHAASQVHVLPLGAFPQPICRQVEKHLSS